MALDLSLVAFDLPLVVLDVLGWPIWTLDQEPLDVDQEPRVQIKNHQNQKGKTTFGTNNYKTRSKKARNKGEGKMEKEKRKKKD